jgi:hypothetical protein
MNNVWLTLIVLKVKRGSVMSKNSYDNKEMVVIVIVFVVLTLVLAFIVSVL